MEHLVTAFEELEKGNFETKLFNVKVYTKSFIKLEGTSLVMVKDHSSRWLLALGKGNLFNDLEGTVIQEGRKVCPLIHQNRLVK